LAGQVRKRNTVKDPLAAFVRLRACYPVEMEIFVVMDNLEHAQARAAEGRSWPHNIEPVYIRTYASWLSAIDHFGALKKFAIAGSDDPSHEFRRWRIARATSPGATGPRAATRPPSPGSHGLSCPGTSHQ
jgi:hypothetical protein